MSHSQFKINIYLFKYMLDISTFIRLGVICSTLFILKLKKVQTIIGMSNGLY